jgi:hypothetical protein
MIRIRHASIRRPRLAFIAGLLALFLQVLVPALPPAAMAGAMDLAAATPEEAASFAATCLGLGQSGSGIPAPLGQHVKCPICLSLAQAQGFAPAPALTPLPIAWPQTRPSPSVAEIAATIAASAFASRAPPVA